MPAFMRPFFPQHFRPLDSAVAAPDGNGEELVPMRDRHAVVNAWGIVIDRLLRIADRYCRQDVNRIADRVLGEWLADGD